MGLPVSNCISWKSGSSLSSRSTARAEIPCSKAAFTRSYRSSCFRASLSPMDACLATFCMRVSTVSKSFNCNSVSMTSLSRIGSTLPSTWTMLSSSKHRNTCKMAWVSRMLAKNLLPSPSPLLAPFTRPAMSTISTVVGTVFCGWTISTSFSNRSSGTLMTPRFGSMVQKGKFALCALALDRQLKRVDLPTLGRPTMPHFRAMGSGFGGQR